MGLILGKMPRIGVYNHVILFVRKAVVSFKSMLITSKYNWSALNSFQINELV